MRPQWRACRTSSYFFPSLHDDTFREQRVETHGPLGTLWAGLGMGAYYLALIWINSLLGVFLTPLFIIPLTWMQDAAKAKQAR